MPRSRRCARWVACSFLFIIISFQTRQRLHSIDCCIPTTQEHAPLTKTELSGGPPARCEKNSALASALDRLARLEKNAGGDAFKIRSYVAAASEIRALDRVVDSGKACAKSGPTKVKGIGKGIAEKIDDFLVSGTMQRILELESGAVA